MPRLPLSRASARRRQFFTVVSTTVALPRPADATPPPSDAERAVAIAEPVPVATSFAIADA
jgi:hypothetical protein